jgi:putative membrane protein
MMGYGFPLFGGFGGILMVIFWGLVLWGIISLIRGSVENGHTHNGGRNEKSALDILKERYAKGEINKEEFESKKKDLS